jgi:beta-glucosidase
MPEGSNEGGKRFLTGFTATLLLAGLIHQLLLAFFQSGQCDLTESAPAEGIPQFPPGLEFGASTSAYEIEEDVPRSVWHIWGQNESRTVHRSVNRPGEFRGYSHFLEDAKLAKSMGCTIYRLSFSWARLNPRRDEFNQTAMDNYRYWLLDLQTLGLKPLLTLWHFEHPGWLEERGGVSSEDFVAAFKNFTAYVVSEIGDLCDLYHTVNEPVAFAFASTLGGVRPSGKSGLRAFVTQTATLFKCHAAGYDIIKDYNPKARVSFAANVAPLVQAHKWCLLEAVFCWVFSGYNSMAFDVFLTGQVRFWGITSDVPGIQGKLDFISVNHYCVIFAHLWGLWCSTFSTRWMFFGIYGEGALETNASGWGMKASSLAATVRWVDRIYTPRNLSFVISEHGCADWRDERRTSFLRESLMYVSQLPKSIRVMAYVPWTLLYDYEWVNGSKMRFGLSGPNVTRFGRARGQSAKLFKDIIAAQRSTAE